MSSKKKANVSNLHEEPFADAIVRIVDAVGVATKPLPGQPTHGRGPGEAVFEAERRVQPQQDPGYQNPYLRRKIQSH